MMTTSQSSLMNHLLTMYNQSSEAIFFLNSEGQILHLNKAAEEIVEPKILQAMLQGQRGAICLTCQGYTSSEEQITCKSCYLDNPTNDFSSFQIYLDTKGKGIIPYTASFQVIDEQSGLHLLMLRSITKQMETQNLLLKNTTVKRVIKAQEDERKRISRELHDSVAQEVLSTLVDIRLIKYLQTKEETNKKIMQIESSLSRLLEEISSMSVELRPSSLDDLGIEAAFRSHFKWIEENHGIVIHYTHEMKGKRFNSEIETVVYRVGQEALFNAIKYADVDELFVHLYERKDKIVLHVIDQGKGFDLLNYEVKGTGLGLFGMRERAELVNGDVYIQSTMDKGTKVTLEVPI